MFLVIREQKFDKNNIVKELFKTGLNTAPGRGKGRKKDLDFLLFF
jgi:hypothetical protein